MSNGKKMLYKNDNKLKEHSKYVPQYQSLDLEPIIIGDNANSSLLIKANELPLTNPRAPKPAIRQSFPNENTQQKQFPNIGNNSDHFWSNFDDSELDQNHQMIDNNDSFSDSAFTLPSLDKSSNDGPTPKVINPTDNGLYSNLSELEEEKYILLLDGKPICSGNLLEVQEDACALVFGEHELCSNKPIAVERLIVLKKAKIKLGLFLE